jgi:hypothetical protein
MREYPMKAKKSRKVKKPKLFDPDKIMTGLCQSLKCDLEPLLHADQGVHPSIHYAVERQLANFSKKYLPVTHDREGLEQSTFSKFEEINAHMLDTNVKVLFTAPSPDTRIQTDTPFMDKVHLRARAIVHFVLGDCTEDEWFLYCQHGSGSSIGVPFEDTSVEQKFASGMSSTYGAELYWRRYLEYDFQLYDTLKSIWGTDPSVDIQPVTGSRATTVDKTVEKRRMICVEPTVNMFLQQGLMQVMYDRLKTVGLDVETLQERHKQLARRGSLTLKQGTIDFSSASDCVSIELLRWLLPPKWFDILWSIRCHHTFLNGRWLELQMMSTMGNATTFPLETLVFWSYAHAVRLSLQPGNSLFPEWEHLRVVSVFGDDCIVPSYMASKYCEVMEEVGFWVNSEKSFLGSERFRESCGGDYFAGYNVRPFSLKAPQSRRVSSLPPWLYVIANRLLPRYIMYFGGLGYIYEKELWKFLFRLFEEHDLSIRFVPPDYPDDSGLKWYFDHERLALIYRFRSEPIYEDVHGVRSFSFHKFSYKERRETIQSLRYCLALKSLGKRQMRQLELFYELSGWEPGLYESLQPALSFFSLSRQRKGTPRTSPRKRVGGYVVAKGRSAHWST